MSDFEFDLEENAMDSLVHGVEHFLSATGAKEKRNLKHAVLHVFHAVELFLKARLAEAHPTLIYVKPEQAEDDGAHTVDFAVLVRRLGKVGATLSKEEIDDLTALRKFRNSIEHHKLAASKEDIKNYLGRAMRFLETFLRDELDTELKEHVDATTYEALSEAIHSYKERVARAKEEMDDFLPSDPKSAGDYEVLYCPNCGEETIVNPDRTEDAGKVHCFFCKERFVPSECFRCGRTTLVGLGGEDDEDGELCEECREAIFEH